MKDSTVSILDYVLMFLAVGAILVIGLFWIQSSYKPKNAELEFCNKMAENNNSNSDILQTCMLDFQKKK